MTDRTARTALIIAAGKSSRAGAFKPLLLLGGLTVIEQTLSSFLPLCERLVVVGGSRFDELETHLRKSAFLNRQNADISIVENADYESGMFSSIRCGAKALSNEDFLFCPGDIPGVSAETVRLLAATDGDFVAPRFQGKSGHPVKLSVRVKNAVLNASPEETLRDVLARFEKCVVEVEDPAVHWDVDTPEDYRRMVKYFEDQHRQGAAR